MRWAVRIFALLLGLAIAIQAAVVTVMADPQPAVPIIRLAVPILGVGFLWWYGDRQLALRFLDWLNVRSPQRVRRTSWVIFFASLVYFFGSAIYCQRAFHPTWHDDQMHAVQMQMLAKGYLWHAPHELAEFFDTFHIFVRPVYAPIHFPGTAILNVAGVWLGLNFSVIPLILMSLACVLIYRVVTEISSGSFGITAVLFLWAASNARMLATMVTSHNAMIFLGVLSLWLFLQWRKRRTIAWSMALGLCVAMAGFTRPVDALAFALPIGTGVLIETFRNPRPRRWLAIAAMIVVGMPLVVLQLYFDKAVTGSWLRPPYQAYNDQFHPYTSYGSVRQRDLTLRPDRVSDLPQKQEYYEKFMLSIADKVVTRSFLSVQWNERVQSMMGGSLPGPLLFVFVPLGFLALTNLRRWVVALPAPLMLAFYAPHIFFLSHYPSIVLVSMATLALLGIEFAGRVLAPRWPGTRNFLTMVAMTAAVICCTPFTLLGGYEFTTNGFRAANFVYEKMPTLAQTPALVFCRITGPMYNFHDEPVYNSGAAWPDDAKIVLAQYLGPRNAELIRYYHRIGQNRHVYEFNRNAMVLTYYGTVESIVRAEENRKNAAATQPATRPQE